MNARLTALALSAAVALAACSSHESEKSSSSVASTATQRSAASSTTSPTSSTKPTAPSASSQSPTSSVAAPSRTSPTALTSRTTASAQTPAPTGTTYTCHYEEGDAPCSASEYEENKTAWAQYQAEMNGGVTPSSDVARDSNGFALGGPAYPTLAENPSKAQCTAYRSALVAWSNYQNQHRPAGSQNGLPSSGDVQNLWITCNLNYYSG